MIDEFDLEAIGCRASYVFTADLPEVRTQDIHDKAIRFVYQLTEDDVPALIAEVKRLRKDLLEYGAHGLGCMAGYHKERTTGLELCTCGFDEAKK